MPVPSRLTRKVPEASYLVAENAHRYRPLMRYLYTEHMQHRYTHGMYEILDWMRQQVDPAYAEAQCEQDLKALVDWGNLYAEQDRSRATTVEEFVRRQLRYGLTPYGIAFERLLVELEESRDAGGSLDVGLITLVWERLRELDVRLRSIGEGKPQGRPGEAPQEGTPALGGAVGPGALRDEARLPGERGLPHEVTAQADRGTLQAIFSLWVQVIDSFDKLGSQSSDYLAALHRGAREELDDLEVFLTYKNLLVEYLSSFVNELYDQGQRIRGLLAAWERDGWDKALLHHLVAYETRYRPGAERLPTEEEVRPVRTAEWRRLSGWFRRDGGWETLRKRTAGAIERVARQSQRLMERRGTVGRKRDLEALAVAFARARSLDEAHRLAGLAFGAGAPHHLAGSADNLVLGDDKPVWELSPHPIPLRPVRAGKRQEMGRGAPVRSRRQEQARLRAAEQARRQEEAAVWERLFAQGELNLGELDLEDPALRARLLAVLGRCLASPDRSAQAPDGSRIVLSFPEPFTTGRLQAPDGRLHLPAFRLVRKVQASLRAQALASPQAQPSLQAQPGRGEPRP